jgi:hypothetical protein
MISFVGGLRWGLAAIFFLRPERANTYAAYSVGCAVAWAVLWAIAPAAAKTETGGIFLVAFIRWLVRWTSATIARAVYPPARTGPAVGPTSEPWAERVCSLVAQARGAVTTRLCLIQRSAGEHRACRCVRGTFRALLRREPTSDWGCV